MEHSTNSVQKGKQPTTITRESTRLVEVAPNDIDALEALRSAVELCRAAGMTVRAGNSAMTGELLIAIRGASWVQGEFVPAQVTVGVARTTTEPMP